MSMVKTNTRLRSLAICIAVGVLAVLMLAEAASAAGRWRVDSLSNPTVAPSGTVQYVVQMTNVGDAAIPETIGGDADNCTPGAPLPSDPAKCYTLTATFPPELTPLGSTGFTDGPPCVIDGGRNSITCSAPGNVPQQQALPRAGGPSIMGMAFTATVGPGAAGRLLTTSFEVQGGGAASAATVDSTYFDPAAPGFGVADFDAQVSADAAGSPYTQAAGHPFAASTSIEFESIDHPSPLLGPLWPVEATKTLVVDLPPGFVGDPTAIDQCTTLQLANGDDIQERPLCPPTSQVGTVLVRVNGGGGSVAGPLPVFNMVPPPDVPARFGFQVLGTIVQLDAEIRSESDYGVSVVLRNVPQGVAVQGTTLTLWGAPSDPIHDDERACPDQVAPQNGGDTCQSGAPRKAFLRNPTMCTPDGVGLPTAIAVDSWVDPGDFHAVEIESHLPPAYPTPPEDWGDPQGPTDCERVPFAPDISIRPTTGAADSPSGLNVELRVPQGAFEDPSVISQSDLKDAVVTLPEGFTVNPASASGLGSCTSAQIGLDNRDDPRCPDSSKIGEVSLDTPILEDRLHGAVYLAAQGDNPFRSLLAMYIVARGPGVILKLPGHVEVDPVTGKLTTTFSDQPQAPFSFLSLQLKTGPRAPLRTPTACGIYTATAVFSPWSGGRDVTVRNTFSINTGPNGSPCPSGQFNPKFDAGTTSPIAASYSPFVLDLSREDGTVELSGVDVKLPKGLTGKLAGIPACSDAAIASIPTGDLSLGQGAAQLASPACPAASQVGKVIAGAGAGTPFFLDTGKAYLAGPYKGAPLSFAFVTPAVAGPFDLGNVVIRAAVHVNSVTAEITAKADPLPTVMQGIPLDIRSVKVQMDRPDFTLNPTSCDPTASEGTITGVGGATAAVASRFQVGDCSRLGFKPRLSLSLRGKTKRTGHPALTAILTPRPGDANISKVSVALPKSEFLDQAHIVTVCTRAQFAASACPRGAIYGRATVTTPLFDEPLTGPVYLRSSNNLLPDLVPDLRGPDNLPIKIEAAGRIDEVNGGIRNTFDFVPDAPFTKLVMRLKGGNKGLLQNSRNICKQAFRATVQMDGHNGKIHDFKPVMKADCAKKSKRGNKR